MKYSSKKSNMDKKPNIFKQNREYKSRKNELEKNISELSKELNSAKLADDYVSVYSLENDLCQKRKELRDLNKNHENFVKKIVKVATAIGVALVMAIPSYAGHTTNENFDSSISNAYVEMYQNEKNEQNIDNFKDVEDQLYNQFKSDVKQYVELNNKENLTKDEKSELKNLKKRINSNPIGITKYSLNSLKQKIANSLRY